MGNIGTFPDRRQVILSPGLWKGFDVEVFPPAQACPLRHFKHYSDAMEHAQALRRENGWLIVDNTLDGDGPRAA